MTLKEFSDQFDVLINNQSIIQEFGLNTIVTSLDEYEKSVYLTKAQDEIVKSLYIGTIPGNSFEATEGIRRCLDSLITTKTLFPTTKVAPETISEGFSFSFFELPEDLMYITYESADLADPYCKDRSTVQVIPMRQDEWHNIKNNPFKSPNKRKVIRLDAGESSKNRFVEIVSKEGINKYKIRYIRKPLPIILVPLANENLSIRGRDKKTDCELPDIIHSLIVETAVKMALSDRTMLSNNVNDNNAQ